MEHSSLLGLSFPPPPTLGSHRRGCLLNKKNPFSCKQLTNSSKQEVRPGVPRPWRSRVLLSSSVSLRQTCDPGSPWSPGGWGRGDWHILRALGRPPPSPTRREPGREGGARAQPRPGCARPRKGRLRPRRSPPLPAAAELDPAARDHGPPPAGPAAVAAARPAGGRGGPRGAGERAAEPGVGPRAAGGRRPARPLFLPAGRQLRGPKPHALAPR